MLKVHRWQRVMLNVPLGVKVCIQIIPQMTQFTFFVLFSQVKT